MKKIVLFALLLVSAIASFGQTLLNGSEMFDKTRKEGVYTILNIEKKLLEKDWALFLSKFGKVSQNREIISVSNASIPELSPNAINLSSKLITDKKNTTKVFVSLLTNEGNFIHSGSDNFKVVEKMMQDFSNFATHNEEVRLVEKDADESQKNYDKVVRTGEKIVRDIERNKKEKERLLKNLEENGKDLEKLLKDQEANKVDTENAKISLDEKLKAVGVVKTKQ